MTSEPTFPERFDEDLVESLMELLLAYGIRARVGYLEPRSTQEAMLVSVVPFIGRGFKGSLLLAATRLTVAATCSRIQSEAQLRDWIGELGNQALGCIRRKLQTRMVSIAIGLPAVLGTVNLNQRQIDQRYSRVHAFETAAGLIVAVIDVVESESERVPWEEPSLPDAIQDEIF